MVFMLKTGNRKFFHYGGGGGGGGAVGSYVIQSQQ